MDLEELWTRILYKLFGHYGSCLRKNLQNNQCCYPTIYYPLLLLSCIEIVRRPGVFFAGLRHNVLDFGSCFFPCCLVAFCPVNVTLCKFHLEKWSVFGIQTVIRGVRLLTMYRRKSSSFSFWNLRKSFITPALASLVSFSATPSACSSYLLLVSSTCSCFASCIYLNQTIPRLAYLVPPCLFWINVRHTSECMRDRTE